MALKHNGKKQGISLPGLIDIIFLLLLFAIVKLAGFDSGPKELENGTALRPVLEGMPDISIYKAEKVEDISTLTVQIENFVVDEPPSTRRLLLLKGSKEHPVTYAEAVRDAGENGRIWPLPEKTTMTGISLEMLRGLDLFRTIGDSLIAGIREQYPADDQSNYVEVRAVETTEFALIDFVLQTCASLESRVPLLSVCLLQEQGT